MHNITTFTICLALMLIVSCKTTEQVQREKIVDTLSSRVVKLQKDNADLSFAVNDLQEKLSQFQGKKGEEEYKQKELTQEIVNRIRADLEILHEGLVSLRKDQEATKKEMQEQKAYIAQVVSTLGKISGTPVATGSSKKKATIFEDAISLYGSGKCDQAVVKFKTHIDSAKASNNEKATALHHIGICEHKQKNYDTSIVSLSKLVTNYPKSQRVPEAFFYLGKNFLEKGQKNEAKQAFEEVIKRSPKSKLSESTRKILKTL